MVAITDILFVGLVLTGGGVCGLGLYAYRMWDQIGTTYLAITTVLLGLCGLISGALGFGLGAAYPPDFPQPLWAGIGFVLWSTATVPWILFVLTYTGRYTERRWQTDGALYVPIVLAIIAGGLSFQEIGPTGLFNAVGSVAFIYATGLIVVGSFLLVQATRSYVHLSIVQGLGLSILPVTLMLSLNSVTPLQQNSVTASVAQYVVVFFVGSVGFATVLVWRPLLACTPAVEQIGERVITRETDDLVFVVDEDDRIVKCNTATVEALGDNRDDILGDRLAAVVGHDSETMATQETVALETNAGLRQYDPGISMITHSNDRQLGTVIGLRDVTDRELREQRLSVLNRVLRHNLRNKVDVVKSHVEVLNVESDSPSEHVSVIDEVADEIAELGYNARQIDQFVSDATGPIEVELNDVLQNTLDSLDTDGVSVSVDCTANASVRTRRQALQAALESAIENAIKYASTGVEITVTDQADGYEVRIVDDGPGIPDSELASLDAGVETPLQHGSGLGLWQLQWAVTTIGGDLEFDTTQGTTVRFTVPNQTSQSTTG